MPGVERPWDAYFGGQSFGFDWFSQPRTSLIQLLDAVPNTSYAYSTVKLSSTYSGQCLRVRRSSDNTEQDIGFVNNKLDTATIATFVGNGDGFVTTWYDQSGNGNNATQVTAAKQLYIMKAGSFRSYGPSDEVGLFNLRENRFLSMTYANTPADFSTLFKFRAATVNVFYLPYTHGGSNWQINAEGFILTKLWDYLGNPTTGITTSPRVLVSSYKDNTKLLRSSDGLASNLGTLIGYNAGSSGTIGNSSDGGTEPLEGEIHTCILWPSAITDLDTPYSLAASPLSALDTGLLDVSPTAASVAYSTRKIRNAYTGNCLRVRRSSDNAEQDIGFSGHRLDVTALLSFVGANDGFVVTWYDQSGNSRNATQATTTKQLYVVQAGAVTYFGTKGEVCIWNPAQNRFLGYSLPTDSNGFTSMLTHKRVSGTSGVCWQLGTSGNGPYWQTNDGAARSKLDDTTGPPFGPISNNPSVLIAAYATSSKRLRSSSGTTSNTNGLGYSPNNGLIGTWSDGYGSPENTQFHTCVIWPDSLTDLDSLYQEGAKWL